MAAAVTPYALFFVAMTAPVAVVLVVRGVASCRGGNAGGRGRTVVALAAGAFLLCSAFAVAGWAIPDAFDALPPEQRASVGPALAASPECGQLPFARVLEIEVVRASGDSGPVLQYVCGITPFGVARFGNQAECGEGGWRVPGVLDHSYAGAC